MADSDNEVMSRTEKRKKKKRINVEVSALTETSDRIAPIVGYFSSGYSPNASRTPPDVKVFRHKDHRSSRLDLVVKPKDSNVEFVGKSYEGEATVHQPCNYALGILDKETHTLKVVPIAANKIFRLEPKVMKISSAEEEADGLEEGLTYKERRQRLADLTSLYGTKKQRNYVWSLKLYTHCLFHSVSWKLSMS